MESKIKFEPNPKYRLMDQAREVLRYYYYSYRIEQSYSLDIAVYKSDEPILCGRNSCLKQFVDFTYNIFCDGIDSFFN